MRPPNNSLLKQDLFDDCVTKKKYGNTIVYNKVEIQFQLSQKFKDALLDMLSEAVLKENFLKTCFQNKTNCVFKLFKFFFKEKPLKQGSRKSSFAPKWRWFISWFRFSFHESKGKHGNTLFKISFHHIK